MDFRFIDKGVNKGRESGEGFNGEKRGIERDRIGREVREERDEMSDSFSVNGIGFRRLTGDIMEVMDFRRVNDREMETEGGDGIEDREIVCGGRFSSYEGRVFRERGDKVNEIVDTDMVIREGREIEGIRGFNSDGEGILKYINTDKVREDRMMWIIKRMIRNIIISHSISPPFLGNLIR